MSHEENLYKHYTHPSTSLPIEPSYPMTEQRPTRSRKKNTSAYRQRDHMVLEIYRQQVKAAGCVVNEATALLTYLERLPGSDQLRHETLLRPLLESLSELFLLLRQRDLYAHSLACEEKGQTVGKPLKTPKGEKNE